MGDVVSIDDYRERKKKSFNHKLVGGMDKICGNCQHFGRSAHHFGMCESGCFFTSKMSSCDHWRGMLLDYD